LCGICGYAGISNKILLEKMNNSLYHRGPDDSGIYLDNDFMVGLAMRRLSILDLTGGHQPMANEDNSLWIVFNGEIYNAPELRAELQKRHDFRTRNSDTEVLLRLYEEKGQKCLEDLNGMFAFVIYDKKRKCLFGARDPIGEKPFYYYHDSARQVFAFASELKSLLQDGLVSRLIDKQSLSNYMTLLYVPGRQTIISNVYRLEQGNYFVYDLEHKNLKTDIYWKFNFLPSFRISEEEACMEIRKRLKESIRLRLNSDRPVGCMLSGGIDSSAMVGLLSEMGTKLKTYSLGFVEEGESDWNELPLARKVAERWGVEHNEYVLKPEDLLDDLIQMVWYLDEPYAGGLPSWYVYKFMRRDVVVGLSGTGGDELFGNYGKYTTFLTNRLARYAQFYKDSPVIFKKYYPVFLRMLKIVPEGILNNKRRAYLYGLPEMSEQLVRYFYQAVWYYYDDHAKYENLFSKGFMDGLNPTYNYLQSLFNEAPTDDVINKVAYVDFKTQLSEEFLFNTDRLSMAHSLELRVPFLDPKFVSYVLKIPSGMRTKQDNIKYLLKQSVKDIVPEEILNSPKKGFIIPIKLWLRTRLRPLVEVLLNPKRLDSQGIFQSKFYTQRVVPHLEGNADFTWQIWAMLMFQLWHIVYIEQQAVDKPSFNWRDLC